MAYETVQKLIDAEMTLRVYCHRPSCRHHAKLDLEVVKAKLGPDHPMMHDDIVPKLRCSKCGGKDIGLILSANTGTKGNNPGG